MDKCAILPIADLYIRVSTEEQADKGFSQRYQEEVLRRHCEVNSIQVGSVIYEDFSAKTFNRPQWTKLFKSYKVNKGNRPQVLLFTKWDRFSRNTAEAYATIRSLEALGIQPVATEQPLDITVPENQMTLAFYLTIPEVENARRSLNIKQGLRRAKKEGRCTGLAPVGYINRTTETGVKYIAPIEPCASIMKTAFEQIASKTHNITQAYIHATDNGFNKSKNCFWRAIRNPLYCGKVPIHATPHECEQYVQGTHEPIVSEILFFNVQSIINKKREQLPKRSNIEYLFPLRGFLTCKKCGEVLTGSGSQGRNKKYYYYHCHSNCKSHLRTDKLHHLFVEQLKSFKLSENYYPICLKILKRTLTEEAALKTKTTYHLTKKIDELNNKIKKARDLLLQGDIDGSDYKKIKAGSEVQINILCEKLSALQNKQRQLSKDVNTGLSLFSKLRQLYEEGDIHTKRELTRLIFPEYLVSDGKCFHASPVTGAVKRLYNKEHSFTGLFSYNLSIKKELLTQSDSLIIEQENYETLGLSQQNNVSTSEVNEVMSLINTLAKIITIQLLK
ncbi:recombinase family protein [Chitinophaga sp. XS-30]|uniref:recombinase family protein n=1 Tax=Chitinophaga sp. XS-30 TaxID=2604421 RepID=UPI0011DE4C65|nr:recombinase family protein [Chitinophaga sp. XS-30]QEH41196.1 recombinase family protein [Chitinophaga sp. XS-30]